MKNNVPSPEKANASRANGQKSRGPASLEGKRVSAQNSFHHGLSAKRLVLADEDANLFEELRTQVQGQLNPQNGLEQLLVNQIVATQWRMDRILRIEKETFTRRSLSATGHVMDGPFAFINDAERLGVIGQLAAYEQALTGKLFSSIKLLLKLRKDGFGEDGTSGTDCSHDEAAESSPGDDIQNGLSDEATRDDSTVAESIEPAASNVVEKSVAVSSPAQDEGADTQVAIASSRPSSPPSAATDLKHSLEFKSPVVFDQPRRNGSPYMT